MAEYVADCRPFPKGDHGTQLPVTEGLFGSAVDIPVYIFHEACSLLDSHLPCLGERVGMPLCLEMGAVPYCVDLRKGRNLKFFINNAPANPVLFHIEPARKVIPLDPGCPYQRAGINLPRILAAYLNEVF